MKKLQMLIFFFVCFSFSFCIEAGQEQKSSAHKKKTVCLNMIVKNESKIITRCLSSVKKLIDHWVIVDTGSTDGTQNIIKELMKDIPGELIERPWVNFAHNRNEALNLAKNKADYLLFIDADEEFIFSPDFVMPELGKDFYSIVIHQEGISDSLRILLIDNHLSWRWEGVLHEDILCDQAKDSAILTGVINIHHGNGARSCDAKKYLHDAEILEKSLEKDPYNKRNLFYLAESYAHSNEFAKALKNYEKRVPLGGWDQEIFLSLYNIGRMQELLQMSPEIIAKSYAKAYQYRPSRAEPLYRLVNFYNRQGNFFFSYFIAKSALTIPLSKDPSNVESWVYQYGLLQEFATSAFYLGKYQEAKDACEKILSQQNLPPEVKQSAENNLSIVTPKILYPPKFEGMFAEYEQNSLDLIARFLPQNPVIFEAGAHYGIDTVKFAQKWPQAHIVSFEPNPHAFQKLEQTTRRFPNVHIHPLALNEKSGKATFNISYGPNGNNPLLFDGASSLLQASEGMKKAYQGPQVEVSCVVLDAWCQKNHLDHIDFMWLDLEGMELQVLKSSPKMLNKVLVIYTETNFQEFRKGMTQYKDLKAFLEKSGFRLLSHWYAEGYQGNAIFIKEEIFNKAFQ